jgi:transposase InsO family protein
MHDNGKQFTSNIFKRFLVHNHIKDKRIPNSYPQLQGKVEAYSSFSFPFNQAAVQIHEPLIHPYYEPLYPLVKLLF